VYATAVLTALLFAEPPVGPEAAPAPAPAVPAAEPGATNPAPPAEPYVPPWYLNRPPAVVSPPPAGYPGYPAYPSAGYPAPYAVPPYAWPAPPAPEPEGPRPGDYTHDGFYLRLGLGPGGLTGTSSSSAFLAEFAVGYSVTPRLVLAGGLYSATGIGNAKVKTDTATVTGGVSALPLFGAAVDFYPNPRRGLHFELVLCAGELYLRENGMDWLEDSTGFGIGAALGGGYELWVSRNWSLGGLLRAGFAKGHVSASSDFPSGDTDVATASFGLLFAATFH
jgi:hypothetical protein